MKVFIFSVCLVWNVVFISSKIFAETINDIVYHRYGASLWLRISISYRIDYNFKSYYIFNYRYCINSNKYAKVSIYKFYVNKFIIIMDLGLLIVLGNHVIVFWIKFVWACLIFYSLICSLLYGVSFHLSKNKINSCG